MLRPNARAARFSTSPNPGRGRVVSARVEGLTLDESPQGEPAASERAPHDERLASVLRTGGREAAMLAEEWREDPLIRRHRERGPARQRRHARTRIALSASASCVASTGNGSSSAPRLAITTSATRPGAAVRATRNASRRRRRARLRRTEPRRLRVTAKAARRGASVSRHSTISVGLSIRLPCWKSVWISARRVNRSRRGKGPVRRSAVCVPWLGGA